MTYNMKLNEAPFKKIESGTKTIELRLYDEKRRKLKIGDIIEFKNIVTNDTLKMLIIDLYIYPNFTELYKHFDKISLGYKEDEIANPKDMEKYYSLKKQEKYGVLGIKIKRMMI